MDRGLALTPPPPPKLSSDGNDGSVGHHNGTGSHHHKSCLLMQNTYVPEFPTGQESGHYLSLDLGTTNFRVVLSKLGSGSQKNEFSVKYYDIPDDCRRGPSINLFDFLAASIDDFVTTSTYLSPSSTTTTTCAINGTGGGGGGSGGGVGKRLALGFTFSFPMSMRALNVGLLETWTKNFDCPDAVGRDCARLLQEAIDRVRSGGLPVDVVAILNDSTGTLVKGVYLDGKCSVGMILGTGSNMCYIERADRVEKWVDRCQSEYADCREVAINVESGAFGDNGCIDFVRTQVDRELDRESLFPQSFTFEKYFSGHFIGDLVRRVLVLLASNRVLFDGIVTDELATMGTVSSTDLSIIEGDERESKQFVRQLAARLGYTLPMITDDDVAVVRYASALVTVRATQLISATLAAVVDRIDRRHITVAIDGSLYKHHPKFHDLITDFTRELMMASTDSSSTAGADTATDKTIKLILAEDGSGKGAGLVAAIAHRFWLKHNNSNCPSVSSSSSSSSSLYRFLIRSDITTTAMSNIAATNSSPRVRPCR
ncbi:hexokinase-1-like [Oppia nitens]|uniref:hexokinase-1-like n=1 Tax=Oppia nitens TaxID=1686743 RepID=UPI0023DAB203|nr:hexokinase-1-like [Oppia nitens]